MSITDELREYATNDSLHYCSDYLAIADRIDAEHQKALDEWKAKNGQMWLKGYEECHAELLEGNETLASDLESCGWVRLPEDADGVPIRLCDAMVANDGAAFTVDCVSLHSWGWRIVGDGHDADGNECTVHTYPELCRHQQPDTWERIISDATALGAQMGRRTTQIDDFVARCKALCERTKEDA